MRIATARSLMQKLLLTEYLGVCGLILLEVLHLFVLVVELDHYFLEVDVGLNDCAQRHADF